MGDHPGVTLMPVAPVFATGAVTNTTRAHLLGPTRSGMAVIVKALGTNADAAGMVAPRRRGTRCEGAKMKVARVRRVGTVVAAGAVGLSMLGAGPAVAGPGVPGPTPTPAAQAQAVAAPTDRMTVADQLNPRSDSLGFGEQVAISADGNTAAVRKANVRRDAYTGRVAMFTRDAAGWHEMGSLRNGDRPVHGMALSADGSTIAMARQQDFTDQVQVEVWARNPEGWALTVSLPLPDSGRDPRQVALSADGTELLVSAPTDTYGRGAAVAFHHGPQGWVQEELDPDDETGGSIALSGDGRTAVLSSPAYDNPYDVVYRRTDSGWRRAAGIDRFERNYLGDDDRLSVSYDGSTIAVGNPNTYRPTVAVYGRRPDGRYARTGNFTAQWTTDNALGSSLALSADGTSLLVGAPGRRQKDGLGAGAVFRYVLSAEGWKWGGLLNVGDSTPWDHLGTSVAVSADGSTVLAGAPGRVTSVGSATGGVVVYTTP